MKQLPILDLFKIICSFEWLVHQKPIQAARESNRRKTKDTGGFLRLFRHVLVEITFWYPTIRFPIIKNLYCITESLVKSVSAMGK